MSESHSQANQGAAGLENENRSSVGTRPWAKIHSPVRMCQPVSPSANKTFHPLGPAINNHTNTAIKKKSVKEGTSACPQRVDNAPEKPAARGASEAAGMACDDVAKVDSWIKSGIQRLLSAAEI